MYGHSYEQNRYVIDKSGDKLPLTGGNCPGGDCPGANVLHSINYPHLRAGPSGHFLNWTRVEHACWQRSFTPFTKCNGFFCVASSNRTDMRWNCCCILYVISDKWSELTHAVHTRSNSFIFVVVVKLQIYKTRNIAAKNTRWNTLTLEFSNV